MQKIAPKWQDSSVSKTYLLEEIEVYAAMNEMCFRILHESLEENIGLDDGDVEI